MNDEAPAGVDPGTPNVARMYDYYLGGKNNYAADRAAAERILSLMPEGRRWVRENRLFLAATVKHLAAQGVTQFVDIGAGLPTQNAVHEVAPDARVVYVDIDPVVIAHARALLSDQTRVVAVQADMRDPAAVFSHPLIDLTQPLAVLLVAVLHFVPDDADAAGIVSGLTESLPSGSYVVISHAMPGDISADVVDQGQQVYAASSAGSMTPRPPERLSGLYAGLEPQPPGLINVSRWRPDSTEELDSSKPGFAGVVLQKP